MEWTYTYKFALQNPTNRKVWFLTYKSTRMERGEKSNTTLEVGTYTGIYIAGPWEAKSQSRSGKSRDPTQFTARNSHKGQELPAPPLELEVKWRLSEE